MHPYLLHNGEIRKTSEPVLTPGQTGFLNGWGVFSTLRVKDGVLFAWERHFARMKRDAELMHVPFYSEPTELFQALHRLIEANQAHDATLRVAVVRNRGGLFEGPGIQRDFDCIAFTAPLNNWGQGVRLMVVPQGRHAASIFAGTKVTSWAFNLTWYEEAHLRGYDEVLFLNERQEVAECTSANLFIASGNQVFTPPLTSGCLPGVTRELLVGEIRIPGITVSEKTLYTADLEAADEVFITSTTRDLLPVLSIEGLRIRQGVEVQNRLAAAFREYLGEYVAKVSQATAHVS